MSGNADVGISTGPPPPQLARHYIVTFTIWAYVGPGHRWQRRKTVSLAELAREPLIVLGPDHGTRRLPDSAMADAGVSYEVAAETDVAQVAQALAASGRGVAVVSDDARYGLHGVRIRATQSEELPVPLFGAWDPSHYAAAAISALVAQLAAFSEERYELELR